MISSIVRFVNSRIQKNLYNYINKKQIKCSGFDTLHKPTVD